ncbi:MAG: hypothetical protein P9L88_08230 [Candidatus Tantalella remota]|nr:hypothetical protein [Candidatus Tantalella remota]
MTVFRSLGFARDDKKQDQVSSPGYPAFAEASAFAEAMADKSADRRVPGI